MPNEPPGRSRGELRSAPRGGRPMSAGLPARATKPLDQGFWHRLWREKPLGVAGAIGMLLFLVCGVFAGALSPYGFNEIAPIERLKPPSAAHWFGTDHLGRDMLS